MAKSKKSESAKLARKHRQNRDMRLLGFNPLGVFKVKKKRSK